MDNLFHNFKFRTRLAASKSGRFPTTEIILDNKRLRGVKSAQIIYEIDALPLVRLELMANEIQGELKEVIVKDD